MPIIAITEKKETNINENSDVVLAVSAVSLPNVIDHAGRDEKQRFIEFFAAQIRNPGTRIAYARATRRFSAAVGMNVEDYYPQGRRMWFRLREKGGKDHDVPVHHKAETQCLRKDALP